MDKQEVFAFLNKQKKPVLLDYLQAAFDEMTAKQCQAVFADAVRQPAKAAVDGDELREEIDEFLRASLARKYYAPFNVNSKNFMNVPEKTTEWCAAFGDFVAAASELAAEGKHAQAVACFAPLYELLDALESGKEIIFAEEVGSWMIPADRKVWLKTYLTSLAASSTPAQFAEAVAPMLRRDSDEASSASVSAAARAVASPEQKTALQAEVKRRKARTKPKP